MADTQARLRDFALSLPGAWEDLPWGERVTKPDKKVFVFFGHERRDRAAHEARAGAARGPIARR